MDNRKEKKENLNLDLGGADIKLCFQTWRDPSAAMNAYFSCSKPRLGSQKWLKTTCDSSSLRCKTF